MEKDKGCGKRKWNTSNNERGKSGGYICGKRMLCEDCQKSKGCGKIKQEGWFIGYGKTKPDVLVCGKNGILCPDCQSKKRQAKERKR